MPVVQVVAAAAVAWAVCLVAVVAQAWGKTQSGAQGYIKPRYAVDVAFKKEFLKNNAASLTLQFSDIFRNTAFCQPLRVVLLWY